MRYAEHKSVFDAWLASHKGVLFTEAALEPTTGGTDPRLEWLYDQIAQLGEIDRSVALLLLDGFSYQEIADALGMNESNVGVRIHRIKAHLTKESSREFSHAI